MENANKIHCINFLPVCVEPKPPVRMETLGLGQVYRGHYPRGSLDCPCFHLNGIVFQPNFRQNKTRESCRWGSWHGGKQLLWILCFLCPGSIQTGWNLAHLSSHNFENVEWTNLWCQKTDLDGLFHGSIIMGNLSLNKQVMPTKNTM